MVNFLRFFGRGKRGRSRKDTESGARATPATGDQQGDSAKQTAESSRENQSAVPERPKRSFPTRPQVFEEDAWLEDADDPVQRKTRAEYTGYMLKEMDEYIPEKPLAKAKHFFQKYTMVAAAMKAAEENQAKLRLKASTQEDLDDDDEEEEEDLEWRRPPDLSRAKAEPDPARNMVNEPAAGSEHKKTEEHNKDPPDDLQTKRSADLHEKADYARRKAEREYRKIMKDFRSVDKPPLTTIAAKPTLHL